MSVPLPLSAQGNSDKADGARLAAPLNPELENIRPLLSSVLRGAIPASQKYDKQVGVAAPCWGAVRAMGPRDDGQPNAVTS